MCPDLQMLISQLLRSWFGHEDLADSEGAPLALCPRVGEVPQAEFQCFISSSSVGWTFYVGGCWFCFTIWKLQLVFKEH